MIKSVIVIKFDLSTMPNFAEQIKINLTHKMEKTEQVY